MAEDSQPNERLLIRNRDHVVPAIRTARGNFRKGPPRRDLTSQRPPPYASRPTSKALVGFQSQSFHEARVPQTSGSMFRPRNTRFEQIAVELPHNCWKGVPRSYQSRRRFIAEQTQRIEGEPGVRIRSFIFQDRAMIFRCSRDPHLTPTEEQPSQPNTPLDRFKPPPSPISSISGIPRTPVTEIGKLPRLPPAYISADEVIVGHATQDLDMHPQSTSMDDLVESRVIGAKEATGTPVFSRNSTTPLPKLPEPGLHVFSSGNLTFPPWESPKQTALPRNTHPLNHATTNQLGDVIIIDDSDDEFIPDQPINIEHNITETYPLNTRLLLRDTARVRLLPHDKSRRILSPPSINGLFNISMRGHIEQLDFSPLRHRHTLVSPKSTEAVEDACALVVGNDVFAVLGHLRDTNQISLFNLGHSQPKSIFSLDRPRSNCKGGVSALAAMIQPHMFASGGHDHLVHVWDINPELSSASPKQLGIKHSSLVQSLLAIRDTSHKLVSASADCSVQIWDFASERTVTTFKTSNSIYHVHKTPSPFCTLLEVAHRELQFEIQDHRIVPRQPVQRFGYPSPRFHGRFIKGDTMHHNLVCGGRDGFVRLWDLRNSGAVAASALCSKEEKIVQTLFTPGHSVATCSEGNQISFLDYAVLS